MRNASPHRPVTAASRRAFTLVESVVCTLVVAVLFLVAVQAVGLSGTIQFRAAERARGRALASALLDEIVQQKYQSTSTSPVAFDLVYGGTKPSAGNSRAGFDDVDDYNGYSEKPLVNRDGSSIKGTSDYRRDVSVTLVSPADPAQPSGADAGLKRITVTVMRNKHPVARVSAIRADVP